MPSVPRRVGVFGGTFDPPHVGHQRVAEDVTAALALDRMIWMPAGHPPHKRGAVLSPASDRLEMVRALVEGNPRFEAGRHEIERSGPSYMVDTLRQLTIELPNAELWLVLGVDQFRSLDSWRSPDEILTLARLAVMDRSGESARAHCPEVVTGRMDRVAFVPVRRVDISSTELRRRAGAGEEISDLVSPAVVEVIRRLGLYAG